ncbi:YbaB/EbfC family nucleoid-associated protein [Umezawaea tangerina]|uniref:DNA-binding protein YbaB n=1 Tax=Umezawaea tangerina TaxID=84725 RepID=A0A2T0TCD3_9PSEU|nr:YbaB/EbfC family nucleoid-associated protein [Umezawaea tangerina]PRY43326.1 DNA-binding protein YbaB [Umezawaea tangerina]
MNDPAQRAALEARNAALRTQVDSMLANLERQTSALRDAQAEAVSKTGSATSQDGLVQVVVNAAGIVTDVKFAPAAFERSTPDKLAQSVVRVVQAAAADARRQADAAMAPFQQNVPDLPDLFPGAPSLKDLVPTPPAVPVAPPKRPDDDEPRDSLMDRNDW